MNPNTDQIPFARPSIDSREEEAVLRVLRSGWLTTARECTAFEAEFAQFVGTPHAIAVSSCTAGLHLALEALGLREGDEVITPVHTFASGAEVARYLGAHPRFVDVRAADLNIDPDHVDRAARSSARVRAVIPVHLGGHPCDMDSITDAAVVHGLDVVEDAAHALPGTWKGAALGTIGRVGVYSFYATKTLTTGEGGMLVTDDAELARRVSIMRLHGIDREVWDRYTSTKPSWMYEIVEAGFKYNLPDILAAIGRVQLTKTKSMWYRRQEIAREYRRGLADRDYLRLPPDSDSSSWHLFITRIVPSKLAITRDEFIAKLAERGIGTSVHYIPLHIMPYYSQKYDLRPEDFPVSLEAYETAMSLPIYPSLTDDAVHRVVSEVIRIGDAARR